MPPSPREERGSTSDLDSRCDPRGGTGAGTSGGASTTPARDGVPAHIVLLRSEGVGQQEVASRLGVSAPSVSKWSQRFDREGLDGLEDKPGPGAKPSIPLATVRRVVEEAGKAPPGRRRWSTRSLARELGISAHSVARIWQRQGSSRIEADLQGLAGPEVRGEVLGWGGSVSGSP